MFQSFTVSKFWSLEHRHVRSKHGISIMCEMDNNIAMLSTIPARYWATPTATTIIHSYPQTRSQTPLWICRMRNSISLFPQLAVVIRTHTRTNPKHLSTSSTTWRQQPQTRGPKHFTIRYAHRETEDSAWVSNAHVHCSQRNRMSKATATLYRRGAIQ